MSVFFWTRDELPASGNEPVHPHDGLLHRPACAILIVAAAVAIGLALGLGLGLGLRQACDCGVTGGRQLLLSNGNLIDRG